MLHPYHHLFQSLIRYKYAVLFPLAVVEGPMVTVISGILVARMPWRKFAKYMGVVDLVKSAALLTLGYSSGRAILRMSGYLGWCAAAVLVLLTLAAWLALQKRRAA